jgi:hypothetical protein
MLAFAKRKKENLSAVKKTDGSKIGTSAAPTIVNGRGVRPKHGKQFNSND